MVGFFLANVSSAEDKKPLALNAYVKLRVVGLYSSKSAAFAAASKKAKPYGQTVDRVKVIGALHQNLWVDLGLMRGIEWKVGTQAAPAANDRRCHGLCVSPSFVGLRLARKSSCDFLASPPQLVAGDGEARKSKTSDGQLPRIPKDLKGVSKCILPRL